MKLNNNQKRGVKRRVELEQGVRPPGSSVFVDKKKYTRKKKHYNSLIYKKLQLKDRRKMVQENLNYQSKLSGVNVK